MKGQKGLLTYYSLITFWPLQAAVSASFQVPLETMLRFFWIIHRPCIEWFSLELLSSKEKVPMKTVDSVDCELPRVTSALYLGICDVFELFKCNSEIIWRVQMEFHSCSMLWGGGRKYVKTRRKYNWNFLPQCFVACENWPTFYSTTNKHTFLIRQN